MTAKETLTAITKHLNEEQVSVLLRYIYTVFPEISDEMINENDEVVVDEFYQNMIHQIDLNDKGEKYSKEELLKELWILSLKNSFLNVQLRNF